jgi:hypothetical protein
VRTSRWYSLRLNVSTAPGPWVVASCCKCAPSPTCTTTIAAMMADPLLPAALLLQWPAARPTALVNCVYGHWRNISE